jgi:hypothetical protein
MKKILMALTVSLAIIGCSSDDSSGGTGNGDKAALVFPEQNSECTTGVAASETQSTVTFQWNAVANAATYFVYVKNLNTQSTLQYNASSNTSMAITLYKATPYSWYVSANKTDNTSANSDTWKFYNAGDAVTSSAPFPADLVAPTMSSSVSGPSVTLQWATTDIDNDIADYKLYFDTNANPTTLAGTFTTPTAAVQVTSGATYYWKVVTTDAEGNASTSPIFQFQVL